MYLFIRLYLQIFRSICSIDLDVDCAQTDKRTIYLIIFLLLFIRVDHLTQK